jgi:hypothetical protein
MKNKIITIIGAFCLVGCLSPPTLQTTSRTVESKVVDNRNYTVGGNPVTSSVGLPMIKRQKYTYEILQYDGYVKGSKNFNLKGRFGEEFFNINFNTQTPLPLRGKCIVEGKAYEVVQFASTGAIANAGFLLDPNTNYAIQNKIAFYHGLKGEWRLQFKDVLANFSQRKNDLNLTPVDTAFKKASKFEILKSFPYINYEIIYSGINDKTINLLYREYDKKDLARTAFYQNLSYTIKDNEPSLIRFKDLEIKVLKAGNEGIEFTVLKDDSTP